MGLFGRLATTFTPTNFYAKAPHESRPDVTIASWGTGFNGTADPASVVQQRVGMDRKDKE
jgi:hypothetical protein